ncbi:LysR family transcriptional regulator [Sphingomonas sp. dw_22]|uniref:LysR family transcriptional regulator n=1 Tax=Sphingomonas sp. dw_22 TaxID=2721175 RepID=UPI001BD24501|nr:LysR family transcriptional regulator [Sphingomonas sp. dw_22]
MLRELETLVAVARLGTFAAAAERVGLTQSAVSSQMQRIEDRLGIRIFERSGRRLTLNPVGVQVLAKAEEILAQWHQLRTLRFDASPRRRLAIGAIPTAQTGVLIGAIAAFRAAHPHVRLHITPGTSIQLMDQLDAGAIAMAVIVRPPFGMPATMRWIPIGTHPYALVCPPALADRGWREILESQPFIFYERTSFGGRAVARFLSRHGIAIDEAIEMDEIEAILRMVAHGIGVSIVPLLGELPAGVVAIRLDDDFRREIGILATTTQDDEAAERFIEHIAGAMPREAL